MPLLKYVLLTEAKNIMWEIHEGICRNHVRGPIPSIQIPKAGLLLVDHEGGLHRVCLEM